MNLRASVLAAVSACLLAGCVSVGQAPEVPYDPVTQDPLYLDPQFPPEIVEISFESHGARLNGIVYMADGKGPHPTVLLLHGYPGNEKNLDLAQTLRRAGYNVVFFHYRGAWGSEGEFSFRHVIEDVGAALDMLRTKRGRYRVDTDHLILVGHSMGGFAALQAAARDTEVGCVASLAGADFGTIAGLTENPAFADEFGAYSDNLQMLAGWSGEKMIAELTENRAEFSLPALAPNLSGKSVLLIAGDQDQDVPPEFFHAPLVEAYTAEPGIELTETVLSGDHSFSWSRIQLMRRVVDWADGCSAD